jgi:hypothetical protein
MVTMSDEVRVVSDWCFECDEHDADCVCADYANGESCY